MWILWNWDLDVKIMNFVQNETWKYEFCRKIIFFSKYDFLEQLHIFAPVCVELTKLKIKSEPAPEKILDFWHSKRICRRTCLINFGFVLQSTRPLLQIHLEKNPFFFVILASAEAKVGFQCAIWKHSGRAFWWYPFHFAELKTHPREEYTAIFVQEDPLIRGTPNSWIF